MKKRLKKVHKGLKRHLHRVSRFEFWPYWLFYFPVFIHYVILSIKAKSFLFPTTTNPSISHSGCVLESKKDIFQILPEEYMPQTVFFSKDDGVGSVLQSMKMKGLRFPVVAKPDVGERGRGVRVLQNKKSLQNYRQNFRGDFHLQSFLEDKLELGVFVVKKPNQKAFISSVVEKSFFQVKGDGKKTLLKLVASHERYFPLTLQVQEMYPEYPWDKVLEKDESFLIEPIGNHSRGTTFLNSNELITQETQEFFGSLLERMPGVSYGRFDIKCTSRQDFLKGKNIKILELNGLFSEPAHIYQPDFSLIEAYKVLFEHWNWIYEISQNNYLQKGVRRSSFREILGLFARYYFSHPSFQNNDHNNQTDQYGPLVGQ